MAAELLWLLNKESVAGSKLLSGQMLQQLTVEQLDARLGLRRARNEATQEWVQQQQALHALGKHMTPAGGRVHGG